MSLHAMLTGGDPRSLQGVKAVVVRVLDDEDLLPELFDCVFGDDEIVRMRAADALEKVCVQRPDRLQPYVGRLLGEVAAIDQPSVRWHLAQMLGEISLGRDDRTRAVALLKENLARADDWIVINSSLSTLVALARTDDELMPYVLRQLERFEQDPLKAVAKRASTLRRALRWRSRGARRGDPGRETRRPDGRDAPFFCAMPRGRPFQRTSSGRNI